MRPSSSPPRQLALACLVAVTAVGGSARAAVPAPAGVPSGYAFTHHGWFHPSCVLRVGEDESVGSDFVIRARNGNARAAIRPCAYPRFDRAGRALTTGGRANTGAPVQAAPLPAGPLYDGYIVYYEYGGSIPVGPKLVTDWTVPLTPAHVSNQDIAFFNDITTSADGGDILQPVLDFNGGLDGRWSIESEHCCINGNDMQTTPITVAPGDTIRGTVTGTSCTAAGCQSWTVTTADVTSGKSTTLNTTAPGGVPHGVTPGALESYGVTSCDMFPASGETTFTNNSFTDANGAVQSPKYTLYMLQGVNAEVPRNCGYGGRTSGNSYTLVYGEVPDGGAVDAGGPRDAAGDGRDGGGGSGNDASVGGRGGSGQGGRGGGGGAAAGTGGAAGSASTGGRGGDQGGRGGGGASAGASGRGGAGAAGTTGAAGTIGTAGTTGTAGATGTAGTTGTAGASGAAGSGGGSSRDAGASGAGGAAPGNSGSASGCGCEAAPGNSAPAALVLLLLALTLARPASRPRRWSRRR